MYTRTRGEGFGAEPKRRIMLGTYVLRAGYYEAYYGKALRARRKIADDFTAAFDACDAIVTPTSPVPAGQWPCSSEYTPSSTRISSPSG